MRTSSTTAKIQPIQPRAEPVAGPVVPAAQSVPQDPIDIAVSVEVTTAGGFPVEHSLVVTFDRTNGTVHGDGVLYYAGGSVGLPVPHRLAVTLLGGMPRFRQGAWFASPMRARLDAIAEETRAHRGTR